MPLTLSLAFVVATAALPWAGAFVKSEWSRVTTAQWAVESSWGISLPQHLTVLERHAEESFNGDGYRIKVFSSTAGTDLTGTFLDPSTMDDARLTSKESDLVAEANAMFGPQNRFDPAQDSVLKKVALKPDGRTDSEFLLCVFDPEANLFYLYESHI